MGGGANFLTHVGIAFRLQAFTTTADHT